MGIRVYCPNGHKLNVKSFLAGKRGVCPHCGAKFDIPAADASKSDEKKVQSVGSVAAGGTATATLASPSSAEMRAGHGGKGAIGIWQPPTTVPAGKPVVPVTPVAQPLTSGVPVVPVTVPGGGLPGSSATLGTSSPAGVTPVGIGPAPVVPGAPAAAGWPTSPDPLAEAPEACWYVRPPSGGQYGPAKPNIMRQWLAEGRVTGDSLVWREGWTDWKLASATFPSLGAPAPVGPGVALSAPVMTNAQPLAVTPVASASDDPFAALAPATPLTSRRGPAKRRGDGAGRFLAIAVLCVALIVLSALLVYVLQLQ